MLDWLDAIVVRRASQPLLNWAGAKWGITRQGFISEGFYLISFMVAAGEVLHVVTDEHEWWWLAFSIIISAGASFFWGVFGYFSKVFPENNLAMLAQLPALRIFRGVSYAMFFMGLVVLSGFLLSWDIPRVQTMMNLVQSAIALIVFGAMLCENPPKKRKKEESKDITSDFASQWG